MYKAGDIKKVVLHYDSREPKLNRSNRKLFDYFPNGVFPLKNKKDFDNNLSKYKEREEFYKKMNSTRNRKTYRKPYMEDESELTFRPKLSKVTRSLTSSDMRIIRRNVYERTKARVINTVKEVTKECSFNPKITKRNVDVSEKSVFLRLYKTPKNKPEDVKEAPTRSCNTEKIRKWNSCNLTSRVESEIQKYRDKGLKARESSNKKACDMRKELQNGKYKSNKRNAMSVNLNKINKSRSLVLDEPKYHKTVMSECSIDVSNEPEDDLNRTEIARQTEMLQEIMNKAYKILNKTQ